MNLKRFATVPRVAAAVAASLIAPLFITAAALGTPSDNGDGARLFAAVRQATARYHNLDTALADGYIPLGHAHCVDNPGIGAMGRHYYNPALLHDGVLDPAKPELLVYAPSGNGARLAAAEYMMPVSTWDGPAAPRLFGVPFDGPMPEHEPDTSGDHYDLHVWVWAHNPAGALATWNPAVAC